MAATVLRSQSVMSLVSAIGPAVGGLVDLVSGKPDHECALFERLDEDGCRRTLTMEYATFVEMGRPDEITISIEPGDRLNEEV